MIQNIAMSLFAGFASFLTPCIFPILPAYISYIAGVSFKDLQEEKVSRLVIIGKTLFFVAGFSLVFILLGIFATGVGNLLGRVSPVINSIAGGIVILFGLHFIFDFFKILNREKKLHFKGDPAGYVGAFLIGIAFGAGWTPCIGPFLGMLFVLASTKKTAVEGIIYFGFYSAGLGIPFVLTGIFFSFFLRIMKKINPYLGIVKKVSGIFLIIVGIFIIIGSMEYFTEILMRFAFFLENERQTNPSGVNLFSGLLFIIPALLILGFYIFKMIKEKKILMLPVRIIFFSLFLLLSILMFCGIIDIARIFINWLNYQGYEGFIPL
jgi:cytochrome c-type biogenesis protein